MGLTGLQIFKLLPNKNCGECGVPTCLAFAMKLAARAVDPKTCPYISEEALEVLSSSQSPPIKEIVFPLKDRTVTIGKETVLFRHQKTFINKPVIALEISDALTESEFRVAIEKIKSYNFSRVGERLFPEGVALRYDSGDRANFLKKYKIMSELDYLLILTGIDSKLLKQILTIETNLERVVVNSINYDNLNEFVDTIGGKPVKIVLEGKDLKSLFNLVNYAQQKGVKGILLKVSTGSLAETLRINVFLRRLAICKNFKYAGYPIFTECNDPILSGVVGICKYSSILVLRKYSSESLFALLTLRQNIYTDPQKPLQVEPGLYPIGEPRGKSPLLVTTNFSLTYFTVSSEIESSPWSAHLLIIDSEGMSVLTAWAANKFSPKSIAKSIRSTKVDQIISHRRIIIPGYVAVMKGELEEKLPGWEVMVGPQEAADVPVYLKKVWQ